MRTFDEWVIASHRLPGAKENPWLTMDFQALGRLDIEIYELWETRKKLIDPPKSHSAQLFNIQESLRQQKAFEYSRLWVLAGYELVRILKESNPDKFQVIHDRFRSVRIPLAKYEKALDKNHKLNIARLGIKASSGGIGWEISPQEFITREQLASSLLRLI